MLFTIFTVIIGIFTALIDLLFTVIADKAAGKWRDWLGFSLTILIPCFLMGLLADYITGL